MLYFSEEPDIRIIYFKKGPLKDGGSYTEIKGAVQKIDPITHTLKIRDGIQIAMEDIWVINGECFEDLDPSE